MNYYFFIHTSVNPVKGLVYRIRLGTKAPGTRKKANPDQSVQIQSSQFNRQQSQKKKA
uniref:Uncharacterized protein n=1 Tax=Cucumis melo TaxID=3656 RepID=A0A9I9D8F1_CUCME